MKNRVMIAVAVLLILITAGCQKDPISPVVGGEMGKKVNVELSFRLQAPTAPENEIKTKSISENFMVEFGSIAAPSTTKAADGITLYNLYVFQFNANGTRTQKPIFIDNVVASSADNVVQLPITLTVGKNQTLYLVALGRALTNDLMEIQSLAALKNYPFTYVDIIDGVTSSKIKSEDDVPFSGKADNVNIIQSESEGTGQIKYDDSSGFIGGIMMKRLVSKVALNYAFDINDYSVSGVKLKSVPSQFSIEPSSSNNITYVDMLMQKPNPDALYNNPSWYIAPNKQGIVESIIIESNRYKRFNEEDGTPLVGGTAPNQASYFELWTKDKNSTEYVVYQIYIGNNNTSDFNIESNNYYNINTQIGGEISSIIDDNRIRKYSVKHFVQLASKHHYSESSDGNDMNDRDIDAHYDFRPIVINTDGRSVTVGIYTDSDCKTEASADSWLQISPYPNYTLAKRAKSLSNSATINVNDPSKVILYLYNDEYIPDDLSSTQRRTLYVQVRTTTLNMPDAIKSTDRFQMDQVPPVYLGRFGGAFDEYVGYQSGLVMDCIQEGSFSYVAALPPPLKTRDNYYFGYKDMEEIDGYGVGNASHGAAATRAFAENKNGYTIDNTNKIPQTNGDLYQYNYYNTFAARFCYDMNRDLDGNGKIDDDELKWYLPTINQLLGYWLSEEDISERDIDKWSINRSYFSQGHVYSIQSNHTLVYCVRDVK